jgi:hypothetical protein
VKFVIRLRKRDMRRFLEESGMSDPREAFDLALTIGLLTLTAASRGKAAKA